MDVVPVVVVLPPHDRRCYVLAGDLPRLKIEAAAPTSLPGDQMDERETTPMSAGNATANRPGVNKPGSAARQTSRGPAPAPVGRADEAPPTAHRRGIDEFKMHRDATAGNMARAVGSRRGKRPAP